MRWILSSRVEAFVAAAGSWLREDPVDNTVVLTAVDEHRGGQRWATGPPLFGWYAADGRDVQAVVCRFPPYELVLSAMPDAAVVDLAAALHEVQVPAVRGPEPVVEAFVRRRTDAGGCTAEVGRRMVLHRLDRLLVPPGPASGAARAAGPADVELVVDWVHRFAAEAGTMSVDRTDWVHTATASGLIWLWHDHGEPVALACRHAAVASVSRVGPVYTPPERRGRGYGTAVTAAVTASALAADADRTVLFADLGNPTANAVYAAIGYRPVRADATTHLRTSTDVAG